MLQRAASNAHSWWWASHIRTKQSKWLEHNLQDLEERVTMVLKLIEEDGDSFAKRAEMYFKKRPELIYFVEESYRAYRSLAERYDHISTELQNANAVIASVFPDQVQFAMDDDDQFGSPCFRNKPFVNAKGDVPMVPKSHVKDLKGLEDEFGEGMVMEDEEARNVMVTTAIKSCNEALIRLQEKRERSVREAEVEQKRIKDAGEKLVAFKNEFGLEKASSREGEEHDGNNKIDELVNEVINLETAVSSQLVLIERLRVEMDELHAHIQALEVDKCTLIDGRNHLMNKLKEMEHRIQDLNRSVEDRNNDLRAHFTEARCNIDHLYEKLRSVKPIEVEQSKENNIDDSNKMPKKANACKEFEAADGSKKENSTAILALEKEVNEDIGFMLSNQSRNISEIEEKFRMNVDELLNENLDFWFRFTAAFQEVSKHETKVKDLQEEISKLEQKMQMQMQEGSSTTKSPLISDVRPLYKHLREVQRKLNSWVERSFSLKDELKTRFSSLCDIQEEITKALKESAADDEFRFTSYQSAKFQGEILNMKQENNKVSEELQTGLDHAKALQLQVERTLAKLSLIKRLGTLRIQEQSNWPTAVLE